MTAAQPSASISTLNACQSAAKAIPKIKEELKSRLAKDFAENADRVYQLYRDTYPDVTPFLIQARIATDRRTRKAAMRQAELKAAQGGAPAYYYIWEWPVPTYDGKFGAVHGVDVGSAIHIHREPMTGCGYSEGIRMVDLFSAAWTNFEKHIGRSWRDRINDLRSPGRLEEVFGQV